MKAFLLVILLLGLLGGGVYVYAPGWLGLDARQADKPAEAGVAEETPATAAPAASAAGVLAVPDAAEARAQAKAAGCPALILWHGSDWVPQADKLAVQWNKLAKRRLPVLLGQVDEKQGTAPYQHDRDALLPTGSFTNLPVAVLLGADDTLLAIYTGKTVLNAAAMEKALEATLGMVPAYMQQVGLARNTEGVEGARAAARALAMQPLETARRNHELKKILNSKDPGHETLLRYLYGMDHLGMYEEINAVLNGGKGAEARFQGAERQFDAGAGFVNQVLQLPECRGELRQQWMSGLAYVYREQFKASGEQAVRDKVVSVYRQVVEIDPVSEYGRGARRWADYWDDKHPYIFEEPYYSNGDMTAEFEKEWRVNVSSQMKGAGVYSFSLTPLPGRNGRMTCKGFQLYANGQHVCDAAEPADKDARTVTFQVPRALQGRVEVRFRVRCFDGWFECAGEMLMKKI